MAQMEHFLEHRSTSICSPPWNCWVSIDLYTKKNIFLNQYITIFNKLSNPKLWTSRAKHKISKLSQHVKRLVGKTNIRKRQLVGVPDTGL